LDVSGNFLVSWTGSEYDFSGISALAKSISNLKELSISNNNIQAEGVRILAPAIEASGPLSSITFGDRSSNYIKKTMVSGSSFTTGSEVEYAGSKYKIVQEVDSDGELKVEPRVVFSATLNTDMTEANLEGLGLGSSGAIIVSAFIPKW
jgi:hypothetical protein